MRIKKSTTLNKLFKDASQSKFKDDNTWWSSWKPSLQKHFPSLDNTQIDVLDKVFNIAHQENIISIKDIREDLLSDMLDVCVFTLNNLDIIHTKSNDDIEDKIERLITSVTTPCHK